MAGWLIRRLGNGMFALIDAVDPDNSPTVTASVTSPSFDTFTRILQGQINDNEEIRCEKPMSYALGYEYVGLGPDGANTADPVWDVVRVEWVSSKKTRMQYRADISWDDRAIGW